MTCKFCEKELGKYSKDNGTFEEGYCDKLCRKAHENQLIKEGKMEGVISLEKLSTVAVMKNYTVRDKSGDKIYFPNDERPYFDPAFRRTFRTIQEKKEFMDKRNIVSSGESDERRVPIEAGLDRVGSRTSFDFTKKRRSHAKSL